MYEFALLGFVVWCVLLVALDTHIEQIDLSPMADMLASLGDVIDEEIDGHPEG